MANDEDKKDETEKDEASKASAEGDQAEESEKAAASSEPESKSESESESAHEDEAEEREVTAASTPEAKSHRPPEPAAAAHPGDAHGHDDHGFAHVVSIPLLAGILTTLLILTYITYAVTKVDLGGQWNLVVAMVIATIKASLVVTFFMHLLWDKKFNLLVFLSSVLFLILFLGMTLTDRKEYQHLIDQKEAVMQAAGQ